MCRPSSQGPLLPASAWINTTDGPRQVSDLVDVEFRHRGIGASIVSCSGFSLVGRRPALLLETRAGIELAIRPDQEILSVTGSRQKFGGGNYVDRAWVPSSALASDQRLSLERYARPSGLTDPREAALGFLLGQMVGDGGYNPEKWPGYVRFWGEHAIFQAERAAEDVKSFLDVDGRFRGATNDMKRGISQVSTKSLDRLAEGLIEPKTKNPLPALEKQSSCFIRGFLKGFFNTDGSPQGTVEKGFSIRLSQVEFAKLQSAQRMLLRLGIDATVHKNRSTASSKLMPDGKGGKKLYSTKPWHELIIARSSIMTFRRIINFGHPDKDRRMAEISENRKRPFYNSPFTSKVLSVRNLQDVEMFRCNLDPSEVICADGLILGSSFSGIPHWLPGHSQARPQRPEGFRPTDSYWAAIAS